MTSQYKFILGRTWDTSRNLAPAITVSDWAKNNVTFSAGVANFTGAVLAASFFGLVGGVRKGKRYRVEFDAKAAGFPKDVYVGAGDFCDPVPVRINSNTYTTFVKELFCLGTDVQDYLFFNSTTNTQITNVKLYELFWNNAINDEPVDFIKTKITKKRSTELNGLIINYISDVTFIGDGYDYIKGRLDSEGFCGRVPVFIQKFNVNSNIYENFYEGEIDLEDCEFFPQVEQVKVEIQDNTNVRLLIKNADVPVTINGFGSGGNQQFRAPDPLFVASLHDASGSYVYTPTAFYVYRLFAQIISMATNMNMAFDSAFFSSGTFDNLAITRGGNLRVNDTSNFNLSFKQLFNELNKIFNIAFKLEIIDNVPTIIIEEKSTFYSATPALQISAVNGVSFVQNKADFVRSVNIGYELIDDTPTGTGLNNKQGNVYQTENLCTDKKLDLVSRYIQSSSVIFNLLDGTITTTKYDTEFVIIQMATASDSLIGTGNVYNEDLDPEDNIERWVESLQSDVYSQQPAEVIDLVLKANDALPFIYEFEYPLIKQDFDLIDQAEKSITFDTDGTTATSKNGYVSEAEFAIETGLTKFKVLTS